MRTARATAAMAGLGSRSHEYYWRIPVHPVIVISLVAEELETRARLTGEATIGGLALDPNDAVRCRTSLGITDLDISVDSHVQIGWVPNEAHA